MVDFTRVRAAVGGLRGVIAKLGDAPKGDHKWKAFTACPFCGKKGCAGVFEREGAEFFKCHHRDCTSGGRVVAEVGYIGMRRGLSEDKPMAGGPSPAYRELLAMAGLLEEFEPTPKVPPPRVKPAPAPPPRAPELDTETNLPSDDGTPETTASGSDGLDAVSLAEICGEIAPGSDDPEFGLAPQGQFSGPDCLSGAAGASELLPPVASAPSDRLPTLAGVSTALALAPAADPGPMLRIVEAPAPGDPAPAPQLTPLEWFYDQLSGTDREWKGVLPDGGSAPFPMPASVAKNLRYVPVSMLAKRGLTPETCAALGFRANPRTNEALLDQMRELFSWEDLVESGLWLPANGQRKLGRRPNTQFFGLGLVGKKPEAERRHKDDKWHWGWCQPTLIPYFDAAGRVVKLRPHKGGAGSGTEAGAERIYVPRARVAALPGAAPPPPESFRTVVVCEGEYKAAAIWQTIGAGARGIFGELHAPVGVCSLPGISFARNHNYRAELESFLRSVGCVRVTVAFDAEDKRDRPMRTRFDSERYARFLAADLKATLRLATSFLDLPDEWKDAKGKADWDGALAAIVGGR